MALRHFCGSTGELQEAQRLATLCSEQTQDSSLYNSHTCQPLRNMACKVLWRVNSQMIGALLDEANYSETLTLLRTIKAMAIESRSPQSVCLLMNVGDDFLCRYVD